MAGDVDSCVGFQAGPATGGVGQQVGLGHQMGLVSQTAWGKRWCRWVMQCLRRWNVGVFIFLIISVPQGLVCSCVPLISQSLGTPPQNNCYSALNRRNRNTVSPSGGASAVEQKTKMWHKAPCTATNQTCAIYSPGLQSSSQSFAVCCVLQCASARCLKESVSGCPEDIFQSTIGKFDQNCRVRLIISCTLR